MRGQGPLWHELCRWRFITIERRVPSKVGFCRKTYVTPYSTGSGYVLEFLRTHHVLIQADMMSWSWRETYGAGQKQGHKRASFHFYIIYLGTHMTGTLVYWSLRRQSLSFVRLSMTGYGHHAMHRTWTFECDVCVCVYAQIVVPLFSRDTQLNLDGEINVTAGVVVDWVGTMTVDSQILACHIGSQKIQPSLSMRDQLFQWCLLLFSLKYPSHWHVRYWICLMTQTYPSNSHDLTRHQTIFMCDPEYIFDSISPWSMSPSPLNTHMFGSQSRKWNWVRFQKTPHGAHTCAAKHHSARWYTFNM